MQLTLHESVCSMEGRSGEEREMRPTRKPWSVRWIDREEKVYAVLLQVPRYFLAVMKDAIFNHVHLVT